MAAILTGSLSGNSWTVEPGTCVSCEDESRLIEAGAARELTEADKPEKVFDLDEGVWKVFKAEKKKKEAE